MRWAARPKNKDYKAAETFLALCYPPDQADRLARKLRGGEPETRRADDILRACQVEPLPGTDPRVQKVLNDALAGKKLPPPLMAITKDGPQLANGLHHVSLAWFSDPAAPVPVIVARDL